MSEDLRQLRVGKTLHTREAEGDCEDFSMGHVCTSKGIMELKEDLQAAAAAAATGQDNLLQQHHNLQAGKPFEPGNADGSCGEASQMNTGIANGMPDLLDGTTPIATKKMTLDDVFPNKLFGKLDMDFRCRYATPRRMSCIQKRHRRGTKTLSLSLSLSLSLYHTS
jgi:hypothetical protein